MDERSLFLQRSWAELSLQANEKRCFPPNHHDADGALIHAQLPHLANDILFYYDKFHPHTRHAVPRWLFDVERRGWIVRWYCFGPNMGYGAPLMTPPRPPAADTNTSPTATEVPIVSATASAAGDLVADNDFGRSISISPNSPVCSPSAAASALASLATDNAAGRIDPSSPNPTASSASTTSSLSSNDGTIDGNCTENCGSPSQDSPGPRGGLFSHVDQLVPSGKWGDDSGGAVGNANA